jgi:hypothetical protein
MTSQDATIALKGMLGISDSDIPPAAAPAPKKKSNKKKDGTSSKKNNAGSKGSGGGNGNPNSNANKKGGKKKKNQKKKNEDVPKTRRKKKGDSKEESSNFAWSAFQSPPDASNLPLPAFGSASFDNDADSNNSKDSNSPRSDDDQLEKNNYASNPSRTCSVSEQDSKQLHQSGESNGTDAVIQTNYVSPNSKALDSASGINIAALALDDAPGVQPAPEMKKEPMDPLAMLMNPSYGANANIGMSPQMGSPYQQPMPHPSYGMQSPMVPPHVHPYASPNQHAMMNQPYAHQVQPNSNFMSNGRMMMPAYPVPVMVPPGVPMYGQHPIMPMSYGQQHAPPHHMQQQQQQQQQQPPKVSSPTKQKKEPSMPAPGSWAAKVAAKPTDGGTDGS